MILDVWRKADHSPISIADLKGQLVRTGTELQRCELGNDVEASNTTNPSSNRSPTSSPTSTSTSSPSITSLQPTTNCSAMGTGSTYVSAWTKTPFTVHCNTDYPGSDILGIWMFTFADCIEACASWNYHQDSPQCYAVSYDYSNEGEFTEQGGMGNCFLKGSGNVVANVKNVTSSAQANFSGHSSG